MSRPPRVLIVMGSNGTGGTELQARALVAGLLKRGVTTSVLVLDGSSGLDGLPADTEVAALDRPSPARAWLVYGRAARNIRRRLKSGEFDVIHGIHARGYALASLAALGLADIRRIAWRRNLGVHLSGRKALATKFLERASLRVTDVVVANSTDVRDYWVTRHGLASAKALVIPNLLQDWRFDVDRSPLADSVRIVSVGGLRSVKGHDVLLKAVNELGRPDVEVVIVGEGDCRSALAAQAQSLGVRLLLPGTQADPRPWLATATIYAHPSLSEGASNAVLEAMAAGVPVVASDVGGMRELLGETGTLVPPGDVRSLRNAIARLLGNPDGRKRLGDAARGRAKEHFSEDAVVEATIRVYKGDLPCVES